MGKAVIKAAILPPLASCLPIPLRLASQHRALRVLRLHPVGRAAGAIARVRAPRHDALEAHGAGLREQRRAVASDSVDAVGPSSHTAPIPLARCAVMGAVTLARIGGNVGSCRDLLPFSISSATLFQMSWPSVSPHRFSSCAFALTF